MRKWFPVIVGASILATSLTAGVLTQGRIQGKTLSTWLTSYWSWALGASNSNHSGNVVFMPLPEGEFDADTGLFVGHLNIQLKRNEHFFLPIFGFTGETYVDDLAPPDDPSSFADMFFTDPDSVTVLVKLDGNVIIDSEVDDLNDFFVPGTYFKNPIPYETPIYRFTNEDGVEVFAEAAIWVKGISFVHTPLSRGQHTLELYVYQHDFGFGFSNTWTITVK